MKPALTAWLILACSLGSAWSYIPDLKTWTQYMNSLAGQRERPMLSRYKAVLQDGSEEFHTFALFRSYYSHQVTSADSDEEFTSLNTGWKRSWRKGKIPPGDPRLPASPGDLLFSAQFQGVLHRLQKSGLQTRRNTTVVHSSERSSGVLYGTPGSHFVLLERDGLRPAAIQQVSAAATTDTASYEHHLWVYEYRDAYRSPASVHLYSWSSTEAVSSAVALTELPWILPGTRGTALKPDTLDKQTWTRLERPRRMTQDEIRSLGIRAKRKPKGT